ALRAEEILSWIRLGNQPGNHRPAEMVKLDRVRCFLLLDFLMVSHLKSNRMAGWKESQMATDIHERWRGRPIALAAPAVFCVSLLFPVIAGLSKDTAAFPKWWGVLDVGIALVLAIAIVGFAQGRVNKHAEEASYRVYRILTHGILVMILVFFLFGD